MSTKPGEIHNRYMYATNTGYGAGFFNEVRAIDTTETAILGEHVLLKSVPPEVRDLVVSPSSRFLFIAHDYRSHGRITIVDTQTSTVAERIDLDFQAGFVAVAPDGQRLYVTSGHQSDGRTSWFTSIDIGEYR